MDPELMMMLLQQGMMPQLQGAGSYQDGTPKAPSVSTQSSQANVLQDWLQIMMDPAMGAMAGVSGIPGGIDYMQYLDDAEGEQAPQVLTPTWDNYRAAQDPLSQQIAQMVEDPSMTRAQINEVIRSAGLSPELTTDYVADVDAMLGERTKAAQAQADFQSKPRKLSPVEQLYRDAGLPSPLEQYDEASLNPGAAATKQKSTETRDAHQSSQKALNTLLARRAAAPGLLEGAPEAPWAPQEAGVGGPSEYDQQSPITKAWWNAQKGANGADRVAAGVLDGAESAFNAPAEMLKSLFRKPKADPEVGSVSGDKWGSQSLMPRHLAQRAQVSDGQVAEATQAAATARKSAVDAHREQVRSNGRTHGATRATRGRTPTGDAVAARQMMMRAFGLV